MPTPDEIKTLSDWLLKVCDCLDDVPVPGVRVDRGTEGNLVHVPHHYDDRCATYLVRFVSIQSEFISHAERVALLVETNKCESIDFDEVATLARALFDSFGDCVGCWVGVLTLPATLFPWSLGKVRRTWAAFHQLIRAVEAVEASTQTDPIENAAAQLLASACWRMPADSDDWN